MTPCFPDTKNKVFYDDYKIVEEHIYSGLNKDIQVYTVSVPAFSLRNPSITQTQLDTQGAFTWASY